MSVERLCGVGVSEDQDIHADMPGIRKESFTYDKQGNLLSDGQATYTYDAFNRMERAELKDGRTQINHYDAEGLRAEMEENGRLVKFLFNPDKEVVAEESEGTFIRYIRGLGLISSDSEKAKTYYHYACDEMGSITHVVSGETGTEENRILNHYEYDAFGNTVVCEETVPNRFRYTGQQYDPVTAQYYLRARYYNPVIGRFLQEDSYYGDGLNLFSYCHNNPLMYYDPSGNSAMAICPEKYNELSERQKAGEKLSDEEMAQMKRHERGKDNPYYQAEYQKGQSSRAAYTEANPGTAKGGSAGKSGKNSGSGSNGIINGKTPAARLADKLRRLSSKKRPNTVAVIRTADGKYYIGYNNAGIYNEQTQTILDELGNVNEFNRKCAEVNAVSRALNAEANLEGATISIAHVRGANNTSGVHGTYKKPCNVCQPLLDYFNITDIH